MPRARIRFRKEGVNNALATHTAALQAVESVFPGHDLEDLIAMDIVALSRDQIVVAPIMWGLDICEALENMGWTREDS